MNLKYAYTTLLIKSAGNISIGRTAAIIEGRAAAHRMTGIPQPAKHIQTNPVFTELYGKLQL